MRAKLPMLLTGLLLTLTACTSGLDDTCGELAATQCGECYACAGGVEGISGGELCGVGASATQAGCEEALTDRCGGQTSARQEPAADLERCEEALGGQSCASLLERFALDRRPEPAACQLFF